MAHSVRTTTTKQATADAGFGGYHDGDYPFRKVADVNDRFSVISDVNDVSGSQGQFGLTNDTDHGRLQTGEHTLGGRQSRPGRWPRNARTMATDAGFTYRERHATSAQQQAQRPANSSGKGTSTEAANPATRSKMVSAAPLSTSTSVESTTPVA